MKLSTPIGIEEADADIFPEVRPPEDDIYLSLMASPDQCLYYTVSGEGILRC
jgi:hypothetical protein